VVGRAGTLVSEQEINATASFLSTSGGIVRRASGMLQEQGALTERQKEVVADGGGEVDDDGGGDGGGGGVVPRTVRVIMTALCEAVGQQLDMAALRARLHLSGVTPNVDEGILRNREEPHIAPPRRSESQGEWIGSGTAAVDPQSRAVQGSSALETSVADETVRLDDVAPEAISESTRTRSKRKRTDGATERASTRLSKRLSTSAETGTSNTSAATAGVAEIVDFNSFSREEKRRRRMLRGIDFLRTVVETLPMNVCDDVLRQFHELNRSTVTSHTVERFGLEYFHGYPLLLRRYKELFISE